MPYDLQTVFGTKPGQVTPEEDFNATERARGADWMARQALMRQEQYKTAAMMQMHSEDIASNQSMQTQRLGSDATIEGMRTAGAANVAGIQTAPEMANIQQRGAIDQRNWQAGQSDRDLQQMLNAKKMQDMQMYAPIDKAVASGIQGAFAPAAPAATTPGTLSAAAAPATGNDLQSQIAADAATHQGNLAAGGQNYYSEMFDPNQGYKQNPSAPLSSPSGVGTDQLGNKISMGNADASMDVVANGGFVPSGLAANAHIPGSTASQDQNRPNTDVNGAGQMGGTGRNNMIDSLLPQIIRSRFGLGADPGATEAGSIARTINDRLANNVDPNNLGAVAAAAATGNMGAISKSLAANQASGDPATVIHNDVDLSAKFNQLVDTIQAASSIGQSRTRGVDQNTVKQALAAFVADPGLAKNRISPDKALAFVKNYVDTALPHSGGILAGLAGAVGFGNNVNETRQTVGLLQ